MAAVTAQPSLTAAIAVAQVCPHDTPRENREGIIRQLPRVGNRLPWRHQFRSKLKALTGRQCAADQQIEHDLPIGTAPNPFFGRALASALASNLEARLVVDAERHGPRYEAHLRCLVMKRTRGLFVRARRKLHAWP